MESPKEYIMIILIWALGAFFSIMSSLNNKIKVSNREGTACCERVFLTILELLSHGAISGLVSVTTFAALSHYYSTYPILLSGSGAVVAGIISDTIIEALKDYVKNRRIP